MEYAKNIFIENVKDTFLNIWLWIPLVVAIFYILIKNNSWKRFLVNLFSILFFLMLSLRIAKQWVGEKEEFVSVVVAIGCFLLCLIRSMKFIIFVLLCFIGLLVIFWNIEDIIYQFIQGLLISSFVYLLSLYIINCIVKERSNYISDEYTKAGYLVGDVNLLILFICFILNLILLISLFKLIYIIT